MDNLESHYRINVAKKNPRYKYGSHYFAVNVTGSNEARKIFDDLTIKFADCYVTVKYWNIAGLDVDENWNWKVG